MGLNFRIVNICLCIYITQVYDALYNFVIMRSVLKLVSWGRSHVAGEEPNIASDGGPCLSCVMHNSGPLRKVTQTHPCVYR